MGFAAAMTGLTGCTAEVAVDVPVPPPEAVGVCEGLLADVPAEVAGQPARDLAADPGAPVAAWGTPPITLRCGVPEPAALEPTSQCFEVDGVGWFAEQGTDGWLFTTIGRTAFVEVGVPSRYAPEADVLVELAGPVSTHDPVETPCV